MEKYRVYISEPAENDLRNIVRYISAQLSAPITALKKTDIIEKAINELAFMSQKCPFVVDERLAMLGYHKLVVKNYTVFYTIDEKSKVVDIERILYARRNWRCIL